MTPAGITTYSVADSMGHRARAFIFTDQTPYQGFLFPWTKLRDFRLSDNLTPHYHRGAVPETVGPEPQGTGRAPLSATKALAKMTNCNHRATKKLSNFLYKNKSGTLVAVG